MSTRLQKFSSGLRWVALGRLSAQLLSWFSTIYVMRLLHPSDYGLAAICAMITSLLALITECGIGAGIIQQKEINKQQLRSVLGASILIVCIASITLFTASPFIAIFFNAPEITPLLQVSVLPLLLTPLIVLPDALSRREMQFKGLALSDFSSAIVASIATITLAYYSYGVWALILGPIFGFTMRAIVLNCVKPCFILPSFNLSVAQPVLSFGFKTATSRMGNYIFTQSDIFIAGKLFNKTSLGEYSVALELAMLPVSKAMSIINQVAYPAIADLKNSEIPTKPTLLHGLKIFTYLIIPSLWGICACAPWLITILIGPSWQGAILPLQIICLALPARLINTLMSTTLQGLGHANLDLKNISTTIFIMPILFLVGAQYGVIGLACAWLVGLPFTTLINIQRSKHILEFGLKEIIKTIIKPILCSGVMLISVYSTGVSLGDFSYTILGLMTLVIQGVMIYTTLFWLTDKETFKEILAILRIKK